jgi:hypothetical protein
MKRLMIALGAITVALVGVAACGSSSNNNTPTAPSNTVTFNINLLPSNEAPTPVSGPEAGTKGTAIITVHKDTNTIDFVATVTGFPAGSSLILSHIHGPNAPAGVPAGVFVNTSMTAGNAPALVNGTATITFNGVSATADQVSQILANPSQFYFNVHSALNPGGVMRGQLQ